MPNDLNNGNDHNGAGDSSSSYGPDNIPDSAYEWFDYIANHSGTYDGGKWARQHKTLDEQKSSIPAVDAAKIVGNVLTSSNPAYEVLGETLAHIMLREVAVPAAINRLKGDMEGRLRRDLTTLEEEIINNFKNDVINGVPHEEAKNSAQKALYDLDNPSADVTLKDLEPGTGFGCFVAGTPILMADWSEKPIEAIAVGDKVMAFDGHGGLEPRAVTHLFRHENREVLEVAGVAVTGLHRFFTDGGEWVPAQELNGVHRLVKADGSTHPVGTVIKSDKLQTVYNFTVEGLHTYVAGGWRVHNVKPIALDLNGDGVELISLAASHAFFDYDGDGYKEKMGWVGPDDGFLIVDLDGDGTVSSAAELVIAAQTEADDTDLEALAAIGDGNGDGVIDAQDAIWSQLLVWQDKNSDGVVDAGEMLTLEELGITAISVVSDGAAFEEEGNLVHGVASYSLADGTTRELYDVDLAASLMGYKELAGDLGVELHLEDEAGVILTAASGIALTLDAAAPTEAAPDGYAGVIGSDLDDTITYSGAGDVLLSGGGGDDVLIGGAGDDWLAGGAGADTLIGGAGDDVIFADAADTIDGGEGFDVVIFSGTAGAHLDLGAAGVEVAIGSQGDDTLIAGDGGAVLIGGGGADTLIGGAGDDLIVADHLDSIQGGRGHDTLILMTDQGMTIKMSQLGVEEVFAGSGDDVITGGGSKNLLVDGGAGDDVITTGAGDDILIGGLGDDVLQGGGGNDVYVFGYGDGNDTIYDRATMTFSVQQLWEMGFWYADKAVTIEVDGGLDAVQFGPGITGDDLILVKDGNNLIIYLKDKDNPDAAVEELGDSLTIRDWFDPNNRVEILSFANGEIATIDPQSLSLDYHVLMVDVETGSPLAASAGGAESDAGATSGALAAAVAAVIAADNDNWLPQGAESQGRVRRPGDRTLWKEAA
jgi:Ca2+-binding RTX toxin-like protein